MKEDFIGNIVNKAIDEAAPKALLMISDFPQYDPTYISKLLSAAADDGRLVRLANGIYTKPAHTHRMAWLCRVWRRLLKL